MYSYCKVNSVADLVITFTVTGDFTLTPVAFTPHSTQLNAGPSRFFLPWPSFFLVPLPLFAYFFFFIVVCFFLVPASFYTVFLLGLLPLFIDNNNVHFTVWFWDSQEGCGGFTKPAVPSGVPLYLCVRDACDIAVDEIIKKVNTYSRCRKSVSSAFITFFFVPRRI